MSTEVLPTCVEQTQSVANVNNAPKMCRQESLLEPPLLKRNSSSYTSIYTIGMENKSATLTESVSNMNEDEIREARYWFFVGFV